MADWTVVLIDLTCHAVSGIRVGSHTGGVAGDTDMPLLRDANQRPVIPGSSLKGVLRSSAERLLRARDERMACDPFTAPCADQELCHVCRLFGSQHQAGRLYVGDLTAPADAPVIIRDGVGIDRDELVAKKGIKYDYEVVAPGVTFSGMMRLDDPQSGEIALIDGLFDLIDLGVITVGGGASRGLGRLAVTNRRYRRFDAATWQPGDEGATVDVAGDRPELQAWGAR